MIDEQTSVKLAEAIKLVRSGKTWRETAKILQVPSPRNGKPLSGSGLSTLAQREFPVEYPRRKKAYTRKDVVRIHTSSARELPNDAELLKQIGDVLTLTALSPAVRVSAIRAMVTCKDRKS